MIGNTLGIACALAAVRLPNLLLHRGMFQRFPGEEAQKREIGRNTTLARKTAKGYGILSRLLFSLRLFFSRRFHVVSAECTKAVQFHSFNARLYPPTPALWASWKFRRITMSMPRYPNLTSMRHDAVRGAAIAISS